VTSIYKNSIVICDARVQRRKYSDEPWLILHHEWIKLDSFGDAIWSECQDGKTVEGIALSLQSRFQIPLYEALAATVGMMEMLRSRGMMQYQERPYEETSGERPDSP